MKFSPVRTLPFTLAASLSLVLAACGSRSSDEEQVREVISKMEIAAEARDTGDVLAFVASDYTDSSGLDKTQLQNFLRGYFLLNPKIELLVSIGEMDFPVAGLSRATIGVTSLPAGDRASFQVELRQEGGEWRVARADRVRE
jgi:hypothetical protein